MKALGYTGLVAAILAVPIDAKAQSTVSDRDDASELAPQTAQMDVIMVTAQRRDERLVDVPVTVTVATDEQLEDLAINDLGGLTQIVPGLKVDVLAHALQPSIRGVGSANAGPNAASPLAIYVDNFYVASPSPWAFNFANMEHIQVLAGPQGTLFGRNATAGAIIITTRGPTDEVEFDADLFYGSWNTVEGNLFVGGPLGEAASASLFATARRSDGFVKNDITGEDANKAKSYAFRGKFEVEPTNNLRFILGGEYGYLDDPSMTQYSPYHERYLSVLFFGAPAVGDRGEVANYGLNYSITEAYGTNLTGELDLGFATLKSFSQYRYDQTDAYLAYEGSELALVYVGYIQTEKTLSQEFNLSSNPGGDLSWVGGLFLFKNEADMPLRLGSSGPNPIDVLSNIGYQEVTSIAPYADATYQIGDLFLTAGIRYSIDTAQKDFYDAASDTLLVAPEKTSKLWSPRAVVKYNLSDTTNVYASYSRGTRPAIYNATSPSLEAANPEKLDAFEIGSKIATGDWQAEVSAYYYDYRDLQVATYDQAVIFLRNAGKVEIYGGQAHVRGRLTDNLTLDTGVAYTHGTYKEFKNIPVYVWPPDENGVFQFPADLSGRVIQRAPRWTGNIGLAYKAVVGGGELALNTNLAYQSKAYFDPNGASEQSGYALLAASAAYTPPNSRFTFSVYGTNLTDKTYLVTVLGSPMGFSQIYAEPRSVGVKVSYGYW